MDRQNEQTCVGYSFENPDDSQSRIIRLRRALCQIAALDSALKIRGFFLDSALKHDTICSVLWLALLHWPEISQGLTPTYTSFCNS
jgi:hypothetical protein